MRKTRITQALGLLLLALLFILTDQAFAQEEDDSIQLPYKAGYTVTQDCHPNGGWISSCPVDLAGGKGTPLYAPISGMVTFIPNDGFGNPRWEVQNSHWRVLFLHGNFQVTSGRVTIGEKIGTEGNNGHVLCFDGKPPNGRDCGYHTHVEIIDLTTGQSVDPRTIEQAKTDKKSKKGIKGETEPAEEPAQPAEEPGLTEEERKTVGYGVVFKPSNPPVLPLPPSTAVSVPQAKAETPWWDFIPPVWRLPLLVVLIGWGLYEIYKYFSRVQYP